MASDDILQAGRTFKGYQLVERLGEGAMGEVWKATQLALRRPVAIKFLKREAAKTENQRNRFLREGEAAARVRHPNVVDVLDVGIVGDTPYLIMEFLEGEELRDFFKRRGPLPLADLADVMLPVCAAVAAAHDEGVIHRDLKPENIFLARNRDRTVVPKVVDFGISRVSDDESGRVNTGTAALMGTPRYMSPEAVQGAKYVDARTDQYALGVMLYQGATGQVPIDEPALFQLLQRVVIGQFHPPRALRPDLPPEFERVILRAMATVADHRFPSVRSLGAALLPFASERTRVSFSDVLSDVARTLPVGPSPEVLLAPAVHPIAPPAPMPHTPTAQVALYGAAPPMVPVPDNTTLSRSVRELPTNPRPASSRNLAPVLVAGAIAAALSMAAVLVAVTRAANTPSSTVPAASTRAPRVAPPTPVIAPPAPIARVPSPTAAPVVAVIDAPHPTPAPTLRRTVVPTPAATPPAPRAVREPVRPPQRRSAIAREAPAAPVFIPPRATTAGGAVID